ncbi:MAG TPA: efflux RND transporter periplasmic adaptor subunit [Chitinophagales bacterium]
MKKSLAFFCAFALLLSACKNKKNDATQTDERLQILNDGEKIVFPNQNSMQFFVTEKIHKSNLNAQLTASAKVAAMVIKSEEGISQNIVLFESPELAGSYTQMFQHLINIRQIQNVNIKQKKINLERTQDLLAHGAATGKDLLDAQTALAMEETNLANERAALIEHETKLKASGFDAEELQRMSAGKAFVICDVPESQISLIQEKDDCVIVFTAFPDEKYTGKVEEIADMMDETTRMFKLRICLNNTDERLKTGMFATVSFGVSQGNDLSVNENSIITVQAKNYVFVKTAVNTFERREVEIGNEINDRVIIVHGLQEGDEVAVKGVMQLKGLSFGY